MKWWTSITFALFMVAFFTFKIYNPDPLVSKPKDATAAIAEDKPHKSEPPVIEDETASMPLDLDPENPHPELTPEPESESVKPPQPVTVEKPEPSRMQSAEEYQVEEKLQKSLVTDKEISKVADITKVSCADKICTIEAEAKGGEIANSFQMSFIDFLQANPDYGSRVKIKPNEDNPRLATFTFIKE